MRLRGGPDIWFHELLPRATIRLAIVVTDAGTTLAEMAMALPYKSIPGEDHNKVASKVGTSHKGEAVMLLLCVRRVAQ